MQELRKPYRILCDTRFASSQEKLKAARKMLKKKEKVIKAMQLSHWKLVILTQCGPLEL